MRIVTRAEKEMYKETASQLKGHQKRLYMARVVKALGRGGQEYASRELGWNRNTIRKYGTPQGAYKRVGGGN